ncbi:MAG: F0F1 ATP synthase subunit A [Alphaproteobacteria bacterium]
MFISSAHAAEGGSPLHQFEIHSLIDISAGSTNLSFTNSSLWMVVVTTAIILLFTISMRRGSMVPGRMQLLSELSYEFVANMVRDNAGDGGKPYFPFIFTLFIFILFANMQGLIPKTFTVTSHVIVTFALAAVVFVGVTIIGIVKHRMRFLTLFVPSGLPIFLVPLLVPIELISYLIRPITLSVRLFANMMAGHTLLVVLSGFAVSLSGFFILPALAPLAVTAAMYGLETIVSFLQAYVFAVLTCLYLHDALHLHDH